MEVEFNDFVAPKYRKRTPNNMSMILYIFWEKGIDINSFNKLPIPYILDILNSYNWVKNEEDRANKRANKK